MVQYDKPETTMFHTAPLYFPQANHGDLTIFNFKTNVPASPDYLTAYLTGKLGIPAGMLLVHGENNAFDTMTNDLEQHYEIKQKVPQDAVFMPYMSVDSNYQKAEIESTQAGYNYYGDAYNKDMIKEITGKDDTLFGFITDDKLDKDTKSRSRFGNFTDTNRVVRKELSNGEVVKGTNKGI